MFDTFLGSGLEVLNCAMNYDGNAIEIKSKILVRHDLEPRILKTHSSSLMLFQCLLSSFILFVVTHIFVATRIQIQFSNSTTSLEHPVAFRHMRTTR